MCPRFLSFFFKAKIGNLLFLLFSFKKVVTFNTPFPIRDMVKNTPSEVRLINYFSSICVMIGLLFSL